MSSVLGVVGVFGVGASVAPTSAAARTPAGVTSAGVTSGAVKVAVAAGAPAGAPIDQALVGVDGPGPSAAAVGSATESAIDGAMGALGLGWVRTDVGFEHSYDCRTWDPTDLDARVQRIEAEGAKPLLIVDYTPSCLEPLPAVPPPGDGNYEPPDAGMHGSTSDQALWDALVEQMAVHEIARGACAFEIWNEPDGTFWYGGLVGYLHLYEDTATALEAAVSKAKAAHSDPCPSVEIGGPALLFSDSGWLEPFLSFVAARHLPLDFVSWHYYGNYPEVGPLFDAGPTVVPPEAPVAYWYNPALRAQSYALQAEQVRSELSRFPTLHPRLWIDEWNVDAGYDERMDGPYDAAFAAAVLDAVQGAGLDRMSFFDVADAARATPPQDWGMLHADGTPKPVYATFRFWHDLAHRTVPVTLWPPQEAADPIGRVGAVAARAATGRLTVLVYDFLPYDATGTDGASGRGPGGHLVVLQVGGLAGGRLHWSRALVDGAHPLGPVVAAGDLDGPRTTLTFTLAPDAVTLLTFDPAS